VVRRRIDSDRGRNGGGRLIRRLALGLLAAAGVSLPVHAQSYFGQNQVQYDSFDWQVLQTEHFQVFYYPSEAKAATDAARMAERAYARLSTVMRHQFREKKPILLYSSRTDFGQNNVTGDLGEGTGGVTEALRHRMLVNFTGDYRSFEHVLTHEMVHAFQYDIFARGKAGNGMQALNEYLPPLWFAEGMAEYLSLGPSHPQTTTWMRDAALNGHLPTVQQMTDKPDEYFPYRYGHSFWTFVGEKWGDEAIGQIMNAVPSIGVERAFRRELGESLDDVGEMWREDLQEKLLPAVGTMDRVRKIAQPLLTPKLTDGEIFLAPALSNDGRRIAFLSNGSIARGQVFIDLWLGDAQTGLRVKRLAASATNTDFEELRLLYSQAAFSKDGMQLAFTAQRSGKDVLYVMDVTNDKSEIIRRFDLPLESAMSPTWSPDAGKMVFSGNHGGITDLYMINADGTRFVQLTDDRYGDMQPQFSPDGKKIAFATDRGPGSDIDHLHFPKWQIAIFDLADRSITVLPGQAGLNLNPQWSPDGKSIAYISDRSGVANLYLYDLDSKTHYQLTNLVGGIGGITEYSPAISWSQGSDKLALTSYENGKYTVWSIVNPRGLKRTPLPPPIVALTSTRPRSSGDSLRDVVIAAAANSFLYRGVNGELRAAANLPLVGDTLAPIVSVAALLDSVTIGLPDTLLFERHDYRPNLQPDFTARPSIGYAPDPSYGRSLFGGATVGMSDMLGNNHLALSAELNGRLAESRLFAGYTNLGRRLQYSFGFSQSPYYFLTADSLSAQSANSSLETQEVTTYIARQLFGVTAYPFSRFTRLELGGGYNSIDRSRWYVTRTIEGTRATSAFQRDSIVPDRALDYFDGQLALVSDNTVQGYTSPLMGQRYRLQFSPVVGGLRWMQGLLDYRRYDPIIFNYLTLASRIYADVSVGPDELAYPKYIARPDFVRGYDRNNTFNLNCPVASSVKTCNAVQLLGSRVGVGNLELRFPVIRKTELGFMPASLPAIDGLVFYDVGIAWSRDQRVFLTRPVEFNVATQRYPLRSFGGGLRLNLFNYAILRWDYAIPIDQAGRRGFWTWSLWPSF
jgi:Tol biopolymer transport system component